MNLAKEFSNMETFTSSTCKSENENNYSGIDSDSSSVIEVTDDEEDCESGIYNSFYYQKNYYASSPSVVSSEDEDEDSASDNVTENSDSEDDCSSSSGSDHNHHQHDELIPGKCILCENLEGLSGEELGKRCQIPSAESWCKCGNCKIVSYHMKSYDRICCREFRNIVGFLKDDDSTIGENSCITNHPKFQSEVLEFGAIFGKITSSQKTKYNGSDRDSKESASKSSNSFVYWVWTQLGYGNNNESNEIGQILLPACVIAKIREVHMKNTPCWYYRNFLASSSRQAQSICEYGQHCTGAANDMYTCRCNRKKC